MIEKKKKKEKILSHVYFLLISLLVVFTTLSKVEGADWYNSAWNYCKKITIDHTKVPNSDQSNFPVLISRTDTDWKDTGNGGHIGQSDGGDILFTASNGTTKLFHEIEKYEPSTGRLNVWVKVTNLSHTTDTEIYIYYGNAGCPNQWDINGTWDEDYKMVQHFQESCAASNCHLDSTSNNNNGTPYSNTTITNLHTDSGKIEGADIFDGIDDYVDCGNNASLNISDVITIEAWAKKSLTGSPPTGTPITNCQELQDMKNDLSENYYLANDIDCSDTVTWNGGAGFEPIGNTDNPFIGIFNGQGYKITNLYINRPSSNNVGLFGKKKLSSGKIKDVGLENVSITGRHFVGALVGEDYSGNVTSCYSTGSVSGNMYVGGLMGYSYPTVLFPSTMTNCYSLCTVMGKEYIGGLIGLSYDGPIINSFAKGNVVGSDVDGRYIGGLVGRNSAGDSVIVDCYATGSVNGKSYVGGLVGLNYGSITRCYSTGNITGDSSLGGLVGLNGTGSTIGDSYWDIETSGRNNMCGSQGVDASGCDDSCGKITAEMKQQSTFVGWNFTNTWLIEESITYPFFQWEWEYLISKGRDAYSLQTNGSGSILYGYINNNEISISISSPTQWHHYVITFNGTDQKLFINGDLKNTSNIGGTIGINGNNVRIGGFKTYFNGAIDEVRISNKARSENWIKTSYNNQNDPGSFYNVGEEIEQYSYQTDNHIKNSGEGTYIGNNIYNTDGSNQTKAQNVDNGIAATYHIRIENDSSNADTFTVTGDSGDSNWTVTYYDALSAGSNITSNITGSGWSSGALVSGGTREIRVEVTPGAGAGGGTSREILITSTSQGDGNADAVKATTIVTSDYQTDNHIKNSAEGTYIGNNIYNTDGSNQTKAQNVDNGITAIYHIRIQNDGNIADTFTVTGTSGAANWTVTYYDALVAGNNITASVTGSGWFTEALDSGGTKEIRIEVTPGAGATGGTSREILITSASQGDGNADAVKATTTVTSDYQTDNHIKNTGEGTYIGNNIYNTDGSNQTKAQNVDNGITAIYHIRIENDGNIADTFTVTGTSGAANWTVTYYDALVAGNNITASVTGSGWFTEALDSGGTKEIRIEVTPGAGATGGTSREILITSASQGDGNADAVKATTTVTSDYQTDNHIKNTGEGTYIGNNIYNTDGSNQTKAQNVDNGITAIYHIRIENDGNIADTFTVTGTSGAANWTVTYYDALVAGNNITASVTGSGWFTGALDSGGTKEIRIEVTPGAGAGGGTSREILITSTSQGDGNADAVKAVTTVDSISNYCVDNQIKNNGETSYLGNGIYNLNGADQTAEQGVENNQTATYHIKVENDGSLPDTFTITGIAGDVNWTIVYYDALSGGNNITDNIIGSGWLTDSLASGGIKEIRVEVTPGGGVGDGLIKEVLINSQSVGDTNKEDVVKAITTCINVAMPYIKIETKADGTGSEVDSQTINSEDSLIVYAVHRDTSGVYVANVEASWGLIEKTRGAVDADLKPALDNKSATFTGHRVGTAKIKAEHTTLRDDSTGMITVVAGNPTHIKIVDNTGREIYTKAIDVGDSFPVYALSKDANENYVEDVAVTWRLIEKVGDIVDSDLVSALNNRSATFKGKGIGKAKIKACHSSLGDDETGDISVRISKTVFHPVYPNPFRLRKDGTVIFQYDLAEDVSSIGIEIYTLAGDLVRKWSGNTRRGRHRIFWDATNQGGRMVSSGMYFIVIKKDGKVISRKRMVIIK